MPRAASSINFEPCKKSRTTSVSVKLPSILTSLDAIPRRYGAREAARSLRFAESNGANFDSFLPNGSALPFALMNSSALVIAQIERSSHSLLVTPQVVKPWPPNTQPFAFGFSFAIFAISSPN